VDWIVAIVLVSLTVRRAVMVEVQSEVLVNVTCLVCIMLANILDY
jgi:hypothetical protein